jgi:hypothetical protein
MRGGYRSGPHLHYTEPQCRDEPVMARLARREDVVSTQPLKRVIREYLAELNATSAPNTVDRPFSPAGFRLLLSRRRVRGGDDLLAPFPIKAPNSVGHYLYASWVICPDLPEEDREVFREEIDAILFRYLNPLSALEGVERTIWLLSETEQHQLSRVLALSPDEEEDYIFLTGAAAQWTGPIRGLHKTMATLAQLLSRHPDFATGKVICRPPATFLLLGEARALERVPTMGIGTDGRGVPTRGVFALDASSYMDALVQLGEAEARELAAVEFTHTGTCIRAHGPLGIPLYRIPHTIAPGAIRSVTLVGTGEVIYQAGMPELVES